MKSTKKSSVPALDRGLDIIEYVIGATQPVGFNGILRDLDISRASAARIVKVLKERGYIRLAPDSGKYCPGTKLSAVGRHLQQAETLRLLTTPLMAELSEQLGNKTVILFIRIGFRMLVVNKVQPEDALSMIDIGKVNADFGNNPWGWLYYFHMTSDERTQAEEKVSKKRLLKSRFESRNHYFEKQGWFFDDCEIQQHRRRLAAPVCYGGSVVAVLGLGANTLDLPDEQVEVCGKQLLGSARKISDLL